MGIILISISKVLNIYLKNHKSKAITSKVSIFKPSISWRMSKPHLFTSNLWKKENNYVKKEVIFSVDGALFRNQEGSKMQMDTICIKLLTKCFHDYIFFDSFDKLYNCKWIKSKLWRGINRPSNISKSISFELFSAS